VDSNRPGVAVFGDLHNHCAISYAHGDLDDALANAALRLDFVSITGHADWPDMDADDPRIAHIVDFHKKGFAKLEAGWEAYLSRIAEFEGRSSLVTYPGYEIHSNEHGDYTIVGREHDLPMRLADSPDELRAAFRQAYGPPSGGTASPPVMLFPHHIGYRRGARGVNWASFREDFSPVVEIYSMHGLADSDHSDKPSLHSMGPWQHYGTMEHGLDLGKRFGVIGNTDHHSGHPGSYGHGLTGAWSASRDRNAIWEALYSRRTWAMTGDAARLWYTVAGVPMGEEAALHDLKSRGSEAAVEIELDATAAIDYVEFLANGRRIGLWWEEPAAPPPSEAIVELELGWGERGKQAEWTVAIDVEGGDILEVIPRFRGPEVVSPLDADGGSVPTRNTVLDASGGSIRFTTSTWGNMTNSTPSTQGIALRLSSPERCRLNVEMNGRRESAQVSELLKGSRSGNLGPIDSPAYRLSAVAPAMYRRSIRWELPNIEDGWVAVKARLKNGHWVIGSPIRIRD